MSGIAKRVQVTKHSLDVLGELFKHGSTFSDILKVSEKLTSAIPFVGVVLVLLGDFLPDEKHAEILRYFDKLSSKIDHVRDDIKELKNIITWRITGLEFGDVVGRLEKGIEYCFEIGKGDERAKRRYQDRLKKFCSNNNYSVDLDALLDGVTGNVFYRSSILDEFYLKTRGDRQKISALASRLLQLVCGGLVVIATYETMVRGNEGAEEIIKTYDSRLKNACTKVQSLLIDCKKKFRDNMKSDLNTFLNKGGSNKELVTEISNFMTRKYYWLENFCLVYNDLHGFDQHCITGYFADSLHHNGKCGIVFYRPKGEAPRFSGKYDLACKIVDNACQVVSGTWRGNAEEGNKNIVAKIKERQIGWTGCAVITRNPELSVRGTFSTKTVSVVARTVTAILLLA